MSRPIRLSSFLLCLLSLSLAAGVAGPRAEAATPAEIAKARQAREQVQAQLRASAVAMARAETALAVSSDAAARAERGLKEAEAELANIQRALGRRASIAYKQGHTPMLEILLTSRRIDDFARRLVLLEKVSGADSESLVRAARARERILEHRSQLTSQRSRQQAETARLRSITADLDARFRAAQAIEGKLLADRDEQLRRQREAEARAARAARILARGSGAVPAAGGFRCPVDGPNSFVDSYGAPRSGGRRHQGTDLMAAQGTPTVAVVDGTIIRMSNSGAGGITLWMRGGNGTEYYYAHLSGYAGVRAGQAVSAGTRVGYVGDTGNAEGGAPHLHFEMHPGGGSAVNPYPTLKAACG